MKHATFLDINLEWVSGHTDLFTVETAYSVVGGDGNTAQKVKRQEERDHTHDNTFNYLHSSEKKLTISNELFAGGINEQGKKPKVKKKSMQTLLYLNKRLGNKE